MEEAMQPGRSYIIKHTTRSTRCSIETLRYRLNIDTFHREPAKTLAFNEMGRVYLKTHIPLMFDPYYKNRNTGGFILIDEITNSTVAAGVIIDKVKQSSLLEQRATTVKGAVICLTGLPKKNQTAVVNKIAGVLKKLKIATEIVSSKDLKRAPLAYELLAKHQVLVLSPEAVKNGKRTIKHYIEIPLDLKTQNIKQCSEKVISTLYQKKYIA